MARQTVTILICDSRERVREGALHFDTEGGPATMSVGAARGEKWWPASKADAEALRDMMAEAMRLWTLPPKGKKRKSQGGLEAWRTKDSNRH